VINFIRGIKLEEKNIYGSSNADELNFDGAGNVELEIKNDDTENIDDTIDEFKEDSDCDKICNPDQFCIKSTEGISINGVKFSRGVYAIGQLVGTITIDEDIKQNLLSTDAKAIASK
jgi:hypothetical protein